MAQKIVHYEMAWDHSEQEGKFLLRFDDDTEKKIAVKSSGEFVAVATVLSSNRAFMWDNLIGTKPGD